jgi:selenocysteine-specific elongation factor
MLIATAGHIDHGKTALVRALTGTDTDRLPEEKGRGISIDLGFAYWRTDAGALIGFVDVPGHERYVRNMLAGLAGVDFALLVVAADDGVMPQTREHARMLDLMGLTRSLVALTKCDKVDAARQDAAARQVTDLLADTGLSGSRILPVSSQTGEGIAELKAALNEASQTPLPPTGGGARFVIDRCFTVSGAGTVVTGTLLAGSLAPGDQLVLSPSGQPVRLRGLQSAGATATGASAGTRCAVNLAGAELSEVHRGDWLVSPALHAPTARIEVQLSIEADRKAPLQHGAAVRLYLGAAEIPARMLSRRQMAVRPGQSGVVTLALGRQVSTVNSDHFVLRDGSGRDLIGGGRVLDPFPPPRLRQGDGREAVIAALALHHPRKCLDALLARGNCGIDCAWFEQTFGLIAEEARALYDEAGARLLGKSNPVMLSAARLAELEQAVLRLLARWHNERPEAGGMTAREIGKTLDARLSADTLAAILRGLAEQQTLEFAGPLLRLPGHKPSFGAAETEMWRALCDWLEGALPRTVTPAELGKELHTSESAARAMLLRRRIAGDLWAIEDTRFMLPAHVAMLAAQADMLVKRSDEGFTAAQFRDATGIGRNHVIRLLEFFDRIGATRRFGELRKMQAGWQSLVGGSDAHA